MNKLENSSVILTDIGYIMKNCFGDVLTDKVYERMTGFSEGVSCVMYNNLWGYLSVEGVELVPCEYSSVSPLNSKGLGCLKKDDRYGIFELSTNKIIPAIFNPEDIYNTYGVIIA